MTRLPGPCRGNLTGLPLYLSDALAAGEQPSIREIAHALGMKPDGVRKAMARLVRAGVIEVDRRAGLPLRVINIITKGESNNE